MKPLVASVAQLVEHRIVIPVVEGSSPFARPSDPLRPTDSPPVVSAPPLSFLPTHGKQQGVHGSST